MVRKLKHHEKKLLKKVDFVQFKSEKNFREVEVIRKYHIQNREDYTKYNKICGLVKSIASKLTALDPRDPFRTKSSEVLLDKLFRTGFVNSTASLSACNKLAVSAICRRRIPVVLVRIKMASTMKDAVKLVEQGHVRVGPRVVTDPAFLVTRTMEDFVTWVDTSRIKKHVAKYNDKLDDFDLLGE